MKTSYAIVCREDDGEPHPGKLELLPRTLRVESGRNGSTQTLELPYAELDAIWIEHRRCAADAAGPAVMLSRRNGPTLCVTAFAQPGVIAELAERLATERLRADDDARLAVVLPIRAGREAKARELLSHGPPFDPRRVGLDRHHVFVTDREAIFFFDAGATPNALERLLAEPELRSAAAAWQDVLDGPPRIAANVYGWARGEDEAGVAVGLGF